MATTAGALLGRKGLSSSVFWILVIVLRTTERTQSVLGPLTTDGGSIASSRRWIVHDPRWLDVYTVFLTKLALATV